MYDSFLLIPNANRLCDAMQTDLLLHSGVSAFSAMTLQQTGPLVPHPPPPPPPPHPPPNLRFLLLLCGDIEPHPGPTGIEDSVRCPETKVDSQAERLEGKLNQLIDMMNTTQSHNKQLERNFQKLEESISANNEQIQLQFSLLKDSVSALQSAVRRNNEQLDSIGNEQNSMSFRLRKLEEEVERQEKNLMRDSDGLRVGADLTKRQRDTLSQLRNQGKHAYFAKGKLVVQESRPYPNRFNSRSTHDQNPTKHAPLSPPMQSSPAGTAEQRPMQRQQQRPQEPVTEPVRRWTAGPSGWRTPPWRKTPLMTSLQMRSVRCLPTGALQWGTGQSLPFPDHLPARPLAWTTHQGHVALVEAPPLAPRSRTPSAEVEAVAGGAEEDPAV